MIKKTVSKEVYSLLKEYAKLGEKINTLKKERDKVIRALFHEGKAPETLTCNVRGMSGVAFVVEKTVSNRTDFKTISEKIIPPETLEKLKKEITTEYNSFYVKL